MKQLTVGKLKEIISELPEDMVVAVSESPGSEYSCYSAYDVDVRPTYFCSDLDDGDGEEGEKVPTLIISAY